LPFPTRINTGLDESSALPFGAATLTSLVEGSRKGEKNAIWTIEWEIARRLSMRKKRHLELVQDVIRGSKYV